MNRFATAEVSNSVDLPDALMDESQLQNIVSWALPAFIGKLNAENQAAASTTASAKDDNPADGEPQIEGMLWGSYVPPNGNQSGFKLDSLALDMMAIMNAKYLFGFELKVCEKRNSQIEIQFGGGQLQFLQFIENDIDIRVCFDTGPIPTGDGETFSLEEIARSFLPTHEVAEAILQRVVACAPRDFVTGHEIDYADPVRCDVESDFVNGNADKNLAAFIREQYSDAVSEREGTSNWERIGWYLAHHFDDTGDLPTNLILIATSHDQLKPVSIENFRIAYRLLTSFEGVNNRLRKAINNAGSLIGKHPTETRQLFKDYKNGVHILLGNIRFDGHRRDQNNAQVQDFCEMLESSVKSLKEKLDSRPDGRKKIRPSEERKTKKHTI